MGPLRRAGARPGGRRLSASGRGWKLVEQSGPADLLVSRTGQPPDDSVVPARRLVACHVTERALVLGSTEPEDDVDRARCRERGIGVVRRRSGGGAVLVAPGSQAWLDVFLPAGDPLLDRDVGRSFLWLGAAWAAAVAAVSEGAIRAEVARPGLERSAWSRRLCFAVVGSGEVTVAGRKVVGISQRRDREGAWFHSMALLRDTSAELVDCLRLGEGQREEALRLLGARAGTVQVSETLLLHAVVESLP